MKREESVWRRVALLGHQTLTDLHELIASSFDRSANTDFSFRFGEQVNLILSCDKVDSASVRLDHLTLKEGQVFEYRSSAGDDTWHDIIVEIIDDE